MENAALRDELALERTRLANERTFLAYVRTALALFAGAAALLQFFHGAYATLLAWLLIAGGGLVLIVGVYRFWRVGKRLAARAPESVGHS